jgi:glycosyltransferase involved in cell wall biosynthesis
MPINSVVIPTYNRHNFLRSAIASVLSQTFQDFEIIVVDDASFTEGAFIIVTEFKDTRIKYIRHELNKGLSASRNTGIKASRGRYIALLDDDDEWLPEKLAMQLDVLEKGPLLLGVIYTGCLKVDKVSGRILERMIPNKRGDLFNDLKREDCVIAGGSTTLLRIECFHKAGLFNESLPAWEAYDMWIRLSKDFHFDYVQKPLVKYYYHVHRINTDVKKLKSGIEIMLAKYGSYFAENKEGYSYHNFSLGILYCFDENIRAGRRAFFKAIIFYPFNAKYYFYLILSLLGVNIFKRSIEIKEKVISALRQKVRSLPYIGGETFG